MDRSILGFTILLATTGFSCGGDSASLDASKPLGQLSSSEQAQLCDAVNHAQGGYGRSITCPDGSPAGTDADRATCVAALPGVAQACAELKVGDMTGCADAIGADLCRFATDAKCQRLRDCMSQP